MARTPTPSRNITEQPRSGLAKLRALVSGFFQSGIRPQHDSETRRKIILINIFLFLGFILLVLMGTVAFVQHDPPLGIMDYIMAAFFCALFFYLRRTGNEPIVAKVGVSIILIFFTFLFFTGGVNTTAFMWLYTFPLFSLYLLGLRKGALATGILFTFCTGFLIVDLVSDTVSVYNSRDFSIRFIPSYLLIFALACLVENSRASARKAILEKQQLLAKTITDLRAKEAELEEAKDQLELRVKLRTAELEQINKHLLLEMKERKWAEEERIRLEAELVRAQKMELLGRLAGGVAHDLNNVLSGIVSYPDLLLLDLPPDSEMRQPLLNIQEAGCRAAAIVQDLLTLARRGITVREPVQLNDIIQDFLQSLESITLQKKYPDIKLETSLAPDLLLITGSPMHLEKMVMNLIVNAFEAITGPGTIRIRTENRTIEEAVQAYDTVMPGTYVVLTISDDGIGISQENLNRIFEPFYTSKVLGRSGTGLGMTVVWGTVKDHEGFLDVQSGAGKGTTMTVFLPAAKVEKDHPQPKDPGLQMIIRGNGERILLVDDSPEQRSLGHSILSTLGYRATTTESGTEAVAMLAEQNFDLILLDMIMEPDMDGLDTFRRIREIHPDQKVIIVSGYSETRRIREAQKEGVCSVVKKPFTLQEIASAIQAEIGPEGKENNS
jgi:signal transduction histidine kinase/ActR/RegA family two-component response regulator